MKTYQKLADLVADYLASSSSKRKEKCVKAANWLQFTMPFSDKLSLDWEKSHENYLHFGAVRVRADLRHSYIVEVDYTHDFGATDVDRLFREWLDKPVVSEYQIETFV